MSDLFLHCQERRWSRPQLEFPHVSLILRSQEMLLLFLFCRCRHGGSEKRHGPRAGSEHDVSAQLFNDMFRLSLILLHMLFSGAVCYTQFLFLSKKGTTRLWNTGNILLL